MGGPQDPGLLAATVAFILGVLVVVAWSVKRWRTWNR